MAPGPASQRGSEEPWWTGETFHLFLANVTDYAIFILDAEGRVRTWNSGAQRIKQYKADEIIGKHFSTFYPPEDVADGKCDLELAVASRVGRYEDEGWRLRKDGSRFWANVVITAVHSPEGQLLGFAKVTRDLTERRASEERLRQSEIRQRLLLDSIQDYAVFMLDPQGLVTTWNPGAQNITGYRTEEIVGKPFSTFYPQEKVRAQHPQHELAIATSAGRYEEEGWRVRKDGSTFWASVVISAIRDEHRHLMGFAKVVRDLTERRNAQRAETARLAAEEANRAKDEFLAILGHELRNPLAPMLTALQLMKLRGDFRSSREQQIIERQARHMVRLLDDLLDVSRIARGALTLKKDRVDLRDVIARSIEMTSTIFEDRRHRLDLEVPARALHVRGDAVRLAQVFGNLLINAAKYTDPAGEIRVVVRIEEGTLIVEVRDNGVGIPEELLPRVFDTFVQGPQTVARSAGGMGIGLSLVRSLVELQGGSVQASSAGPGRGTVLTVRLPLLEEEADAPPSPRSGSFPRSEPEAPRRVLVVDDNEDALVLAAEAIRLAGHDVRTAADGSDALTVAQEFRPEVAILDVGLPGMDGYELARALRTLIPGPSLRLVALTGYGQEGDQQRSRSAGFDVHLVKPVDLEVLIRTVEEPGS